VKVLLSTLHHLILSKQCVLQPTCLRNFDAHRTWDALGYDMVCGVGQCCKCAWMLIFLCLRICCSPQVL